MLTTTAPTRGAPSASPDRRRRFRPLGRPARRSPGGPRGRDAVGGPSKTSRPRQKPRTRSAYRRAVSTWCSVATTVRPVSVATPPERVHDDASRWRGRGSRWARRPGSRSGAWARILAIATRCCSPPDSVSARCHVRSSRPTWARHRRAISRSRGVEPPGEGRPAAPAPQMRQPADQHVVDDAQALHQVELLEDHAHARAMGLQAGGPRSAATSQPPTRIAPSLTGTHAGQAPQERRLARPRPPDHRDELARLDGHRDVVERERLHVALGDLGDHDPGRGRVATAATLGGGRCGV